MKRSGSTLDPNYLQYERFFCSGLFGINAQQTKAPLADGFELMVFRGSNVIVDSELDIQVEHKDSGLQFSCYAEYVSAVREVLERIGKNAAHPDRKCRYGMVTTISRGYDAPATSALAHEIGCDIALTFTRPESYLPDCGTDIARRLGYTTVHEIDANESRKNSEILEALRFSNGAIAGCDFAAHYPLFADSLLFMGERGDSLWERLHENVNNRQDFSNGNTLMQAGLPFSETSMEHNVVTIAVPMIGSDRWEEMADISKSAEMKPWSIGDEYDRPIARRIVEEYGVERSEFGQLKRGAGSSFHLDTVKRLKKRMSPWSYESLLAFRKRYRQNKLKVGSYKAFFMLRNYRPYANYLFSRLHLPLRFKGKPTYLSNPISTMLIAWGIEEAAKRY